MKIFISPKLSHLFLLTGLFILSACGEKFQTYPIQVVHDGVISKAPAVHPNEPSRPAAQTDPNALKFCSPIDFKDIQWDSRLDLNAQRSFAIALSISGEFEGHAAWKNITNNFDGMGLSAGLLNQTLGTESLQPLFEKMARDHQQKFDGQFSSLHLSSILGMLKQWNPAQFQIQEFHPTENDSTLNTLNSNASVQWAVQNLYDSSGNFLHDWKAELQSLLETPEYVNLQVGSALHYHLQALKYLARTGFQDLRSYLLMFDIITQNGSIKESRFQEWDAFILQNKITDEVAALKALVEIRLQDTQAKWRADVRRRKYALIDGTGVVHGVAVNLPKSYCYNSTDPVQ
jgi:hypothetical protein